MREIINIPVPLLEPTAHMFHDHATFSMYYTFGNIIHACIYLLQFPQVQTKSSSLCSKAGPQETQKHQ